jgi:hypothetical protein
MVPGVARVEDQCGERRLLSQLDQPKMISSSVMSRLTPHRPSLSNGMIVLVHAVRLVPFAVGHLDPWPA